MEEMPLQLLPENGLRYHDEHMTGALTPRLFDGAQDDADALDGILNGNVGHDVVLKRDRLVLVGQSGRPVGMLAWRAGGIVHELQTGNSLAQRAIANLLVDYAIRDALHRPFKLHTALFVTDSDRMSTYALALGAREVQGKKLFQLELD